VKYALSRAAIALHVLAFGACGDALFGDDFVAPDLSDIESCEDVADWDPDWVAFENDVLTLVNQARARGHDCDREGAFGKTSALSGNARLTCAARVHSAYMAETGEFSHTEGRNGSQPADRVDTAGYSWGFVGENIAAGQRSPEEVVAGWLESDGHCANIMSPNFEHLGVGYALGGQGTPYWTQVFARPR
jgi:uncharacterized protein YkwD